MTRRARRAILICWSACLLAVAAVLLGALAGGWRLSASWPNALTIILVTAATGLTAGFTAASFLHQAETAREARAQAERLRRVAGDLATSERYLEDFFETAPIGLHWVGADGTILRANRAELQMLGYSREEYVGRNIAEFHADAVRIQDMLARLCRGETIRNYEARLRCKDGSIRTVAVSSSGLFENGRFVHTRCFTRDVTDLREGERALLQARGSLSMALTAGNMGLWTRELAPADRVWWSPELAALFGVTPDEFGRTEDAFLAFVHPDDRRLVTDAVAEALANRTDYDAEFRYFRAGEERWMLGRGRAEYDPDGRPVRLAGVGIDITQAKRAEIERRRAEERYRTIVETASEGVWLIDTRARTLYVNDRMADMLGHTPDEMIGRPVHEFCFPEDLGHARARIRRNLDGHPDQFDFRFRHREGRGVPVLACTNAVRDADGRITGALGLFTDVTARKRADEELRKTSYENQIILDSVPAMIWFKDDRNNVLRVNRHAAEFAGLSPDEIEGRAVSDLYPPRADAYFNDDREVIATGRPKLGIIERIAGPDGAERWVSTDKFPYFDASGRAAGVVVFATDITELRQVESELRRSEETLRLACRAAAAGAWDFDAQRQHLTITPELRELLGLDPSAEFKYESWIELVHPDDRRATEERLRDAWTGASEPRLEYRITRPDGAVRWIESMWVTLIEPGPDGRPRPTRMVGIAQDVTDRRLAAEALARSEERYRLLAENVPQFTWTTGAEGQVDYANQRWYDYTGLTPEQTAGAGWTAAVHPDDAAATLERWSRAVHAGARVEFEYRVRRADGQYRWYLARAIPLRDNAGKVTAWFGTGTDIHEQKLAQDRLAELNAALARSNRDLEDFAHIAAHDLREPLRGMRLCASFLVEDYAGAISPDGRRHLATIDRLGQRMDDLINSLLHYSLVGQAELAVRDVDLNQVIGGVLESLAPVLRESGIEVRIPAPLPTVRCDAVRVGEVYRNLIGNAIKYSTRDERWIEIGARPPDNGEPVPVLYVRDNGIGIAPEHHQTVFRIFKRLHARDEFGGGTGSGLALVKRIIERHGGRIWVESALDEGSAFLFTLGKVAPHAPVEPAHSHR